MLSSLLGEDDPLIILLISEKESFLDLNLSISLVLTVIDPPDEYLIAFDNKHKRFSVNHPLSVIMNLQNSTGIGSKLMANLPCSDCRIDIGHFKDISKLIVSKDGTNLIPCDTLVKSMARLIVIAINTTVASMISILSIISN